MKREGLLRHLRRYGCVLRREGKAHSLWENPQTGSAEAVPRHTEVSGQEDLPKANDPRPA
jgi:mRNA interferase HicA